jgi:hypothetical protein
MKIVNGPEVFSPKVIEGIEKHYKAKYVFDSCIKGRDKYWLNFPAAIFYTDKAHPEGSNYFAMYRNQDGEVMIANGISATEPFTGIEVDGDVIYSVYRHDYRAHKDVFVDGGRDYLRSGGDLDKVKVVTIVVNKDHLEVTREKVLN